MPLGRCRFRCQRLSHVGSPPDSSRVPLPKLRGNDAKYVMDKRFVIERLRQHKPELKAAGIVHLHVFGSVARDEATSASDVDLMADFDKPKQLTLVKVASLQHRLSTILGREVDLTSAEWMRERVRENALREAVLVF
jgi:predicted nucleotidyltransferase